MVSGVIFDMDGVLFDTERLGAAGWKLAARQLNIPLDDAFISHFRGRNIPDSRAYYKARLGRDDYDAARAIRVAYADAIIEKEGVPVKPGVRALLEALKQRGIPAALATGTVRERALGYLRQAGIDGFFSFAIGGDEVAHAKPAPDIFLQAAAGLRRAPSTCMVIEDSVNGLTAARAAGCIPVMVPDLTPYSPELSSVCDAHAERLIDVIPLLERFPN